MVFEGAEVAREGVVSNLTNQVNNGQTSLTNLMGAVVTVVAIVVAGVAIVKAISCIGKKDYKQAAIFGVGAFAAFVLAVIFGLGAIRNTANNVSGNGDLSQVLF